MSARSSLPILLVSAVLLFTAGMNTISLQSLDDAFYARKGVEMARSGNFFTVTLGGEPSFQNPPLQFWIMGRSFALFGENDTAARLPIVIMAVGILLATLRIATLTLTLTLTPSVGAARVPGAAAAADASVGVTAIALLLITPLFVSTARGTMMEIPYGFWIAATFVLFLEGTTARPWPWHLLMAVPIGAAMLTKSVLGLVPIVALPAVIMLSPEVRRRCGLITWLGLVLGVVIGLSWPLDQWWRFGPDALRHHYLGQVLEPSTERFGWSSVFLGYPLILLRSFEPILWPGLAGAVMLARLAWRERNGRALLLVAWIVVPIGIVSLSAAQSSRYIFPILPPVAICGAWWLLRVWPRVAAFVTRALAPGLACLAAAIFWIQPTMLTRDQNQIFKTEAERLRSTIPADAKVGYVGTRYWRIANPLFYYTDRPLTQMASAADLCREPQVVFVFADRDQVESLNQCGLDPTTVLDGSDWVLVKLQGRSAALRLLIPGDGPLQSLIQRHAWRVAE